MNHHFDKCDAHIGRGKTKKRPVIDHENKRLIFFYKYIKLQWKRRLLVSFNKLHPLENYQLLIGWATDESGPTQAHP